MLRPPLINLLVAFPACLGRPGRMIFYITILTAVRAVKAKTGAAASAVARTPSSILLWVGKYGEETDAAQRSRGARHGRWLRARRGNGTRLGGGRRYRRRARYPCPERE